MFTRAACRFPKPHQLAGAPTHSPACASRLLPHRPWGTGGLSSPSTTSLLVPFFPGTTLSYLADAPSVLNKAF